MGRVVERWNSIDVMKLVMAIVVVAIHTYPSKCYENKVIMNLYSAFFGLAVPFFFISTGFFIGKEEGKVDVIKERLVKTIKLYLFWSIVYLPLALIDYINDDYDMLFDICLYIRGLFLLGEHKLSWILWYLLSVIYTLLLIYFLNRRGIDRRKVLLICLCVGLLCSTIFDVLGDYTGNNSVMLLLSKLTEYSIANGRIFRGLIYIPIGIFLSQYHYSLLNNLLMCFGGYIFLLITPSFLPSFANLIWNIICSIGLFGLVIDIKLADKWYYFLFRTVSTVMYFTHLWVWSIYCYFMYHKMKYGVDCFLVSVIVTMVLGVIYYYYKQKQMKRS